MDSEEFDEMGVAEYIMWYLSEHCVPSLIFSFVGFLVGMVVGYCGGYDDAVKLRDDYVRTELSAKWDNELSAYIKFDKVTGRSTWKHFETGRQ